jgi:hypothetical protein
LKLFKLDWFTVLSSRWFQSNTVFMKKEFLNGSVFALWYTRPLELLMTLFSTMFCKNCSPTFLPSRIAEVDPSTYFIQIQIPILLAFFQLLRNILHSHLNLIFAYKICYDIFQVKSGNNTDFQTWPDQTSAMIDKSSGCMNFHASGCVNFQHRCKILYTPNYTKITNNIRQPMFTKYVMTYSK